MKKLTIGIIMLTVVIFQSCNKSDQDCFTPPSPFEFELVDKSSGENLFTNESFNPADIKVINLDDQSNVAFTFIDENDYNIIRILSIGWTTETVYYSVQVSSEKIFKLFVNAERMTEGSCPHTEYHEIQIEDTDYELNEKSGIYKILVE